MGAGGDTIDKSNIIKVVALLVLIAAASVLLVFTFKLEKYDDGMTGRYSSAAVSSDGTPCARIAVEVLANGGTAADAGIAAMFCSGVVNPHSMGIGGGFLMTYYSRSEGRAYSLNARETAPAAASEDMFHGDPNLSLEGGLAVAVPGEVRGYIALFERFGGGVPWADLLAPSIELCELGNPVSWHLANALASRREQILAQPTLHMFVSNSTGDVLQEGDLLLLPDLARTLRQLQQEPDAMYTGSLAPGMLQDLTQLGGIITAEDLTNYTVDWTDALKVHLENVKIPNATLYSVPPPGSGAVLAFMLNVLDEYDLDPSSLDDESKVLTYQRVTETFKYAYALRTFMGDAAYEDMEGLVANLTSEEYARSIKQQVLDNSTSQDPEYYGAYTAPPADYGTSHVSVLSADGDALAATSTINTYFGALIASAQTGILFNNEMDDFSSNFTNFFGVQPSPANFIKPGKRPMSSMSPAVVVDDSGDVRLVIGAAGGTKITTGVALCILNNLWFERTIEEAITARRIHHQLQPMVLEYEENFDQGIVDELAQLGHNVTWYPEGGSVVGGVAVEADGFVHANADFRKSGQVDGY